MGRSNANRVERLNRTIRDFLNRYGRDWSSPETLYNLSLYLNTCSNAKNSKNYGIITPYELFYEVKPDTLRFMKCTRPKIISKPIQSLVNHEIYAREMNPQNLKPINNSRYVVGLKVFYRRGGRKDGKLIPAIVESVGKTTCSIRNKNGLLLCRHFTDLIIPPT